MSSDATARLNVTRAQVLSHRRLVGALDERLPPGPRSLRHAAWAGLQDSMPRAALLSIHARVEGTSPDAWEDPALVQVWGPRYSTYVVAAEDAAIFTLGRLPDDPADRQFAVGVADEVDAFLAGRRMAYGDVGHGMGVNPNRLRYATTTGRILLRWDGARRPTIWTVPAPAMSPQAARLELARRYLHVFGPATGESFAEWAGIPPRAGRAAIASLEGSLTAVRTPIGDGWILAEDEPALRAPARTPAAARLLPSGDAFFLLQGNDRELLVPDAARRPLLWTPRVWPGAVLVDGDVAGTWRRGGASVTVEPWVVLTAAAREAVEAEAAAFPLPGVEGPIRVRWEA